jgi:hypothetical protein
MKDVVIALVFLAIIVAPAFAAIHVPPGNNRF